MGLIFFTMPVKKIRVPYFWYMDRLALHRTVHGSAIKPARFRGII